MTQCEAINIIEKYKNKNGAYNFKKIEMSKDLDFLRNFLDQYCNFKNISISEKVYRLFNNIEIDIPCEVCNNGFCKFQNFKNGYRLVCSPKCSGQREAVKLRRKKTNTIRYGVENCFQSTEMQEKSKKTLLAALGVDNVSKSKYFKNKIKAVWEQKSIGEIEKINEARKKTSNGIYGTDSPSQSNKVKQKVKDTCIQKFGYKSYFNTPHCKNSILEKYGADNIFKTKLGQQLAYGRWWNP